MDYEEEFAGFITAALNSEPQINSIYGNIIWNPYRMFHLNIGLRAAKYNRYSKDMIDPRLSIDQYNFENNNYDIVFAHYGNKEVEENIRDSDWNPGDAVIIYFSGEFRKDRAEQNGKWYVSASFMEKRENICKLLKDISKI